MSVIEQNPTHIHGEHVSQEIRPEGLFKDSSGLFRKKGRKTDGLGAFAKILAGLVGKKAGVKPEHSGMAKTGMEAAGLEAGAEAAGVGTFKNKASPGKIKKTEESLSTALLKRKTEREDAEKARNGELVPYLREPEKETVPEEGESSSSLASHDTENTRQIGDIQERRLPFQNREVPELPLPGEVQNTALRSRSKEEEASPAEDRKEGRKITRRRERFSLEVADLRRGGAEAGSAEQVKGSSGEMSPGDREMVLELRPLQERNAVFGENRETGRAGESFEQILARELNGDLSADIVKQAAIVLRDGGEGTIRLSLKPETLGKVKIRLEMAENKISGHIIVESEEALRAFEREIHSLEQAFKDSGFGEATLSTALDYRNDGRQWKEEGPSPFYSPRLIASNYDGELSEASGGYASGFGYAAVNMLV
jgi:hypothetical protein